MNIHYQIAEESNCRQIAEMVHFATKGMIDFLFHDLIPGMTPTQMIEFSLKEDKDYHTYKNTFIAKYDNDVIGMIFAFDSIHCTINDELQAFVPKERIEHMYNVLTSRVDDSLYIDALFVHENYRKRGIAKKLFSIVKEKAKNDKYSSISLIVLDDNDNAFDLYKKWGFTIVKKIDIEYHDYFKHDGGAYLLKYDL